MAPSYLTRSRLAWLAIVLIVGGFCAKFVADAFGLPAWVVPAGYFTALVGSGVLFVGWVRWKVLHPRPR